MPIAFQQMKQFEALGRQLQGVAAGAAAGAVMTSGLNNLIKTHGTDLMKAQGTVLSDANLSDYRTRTITLDLFKKEYSEDDEDFPLKLRSSM